MSYQIRWRVTNKCNYKCSYCIQSTTQKHKLSWEEEKKNIYAQAKAIKRIIENDTEEEYFNLQIIGGEVSIIPKDMMLEIADIIKSEKIHHVYITSNFSNDNSWYTEVAKKLRENGINVRYNFSLHEECVDCNVFLAKLLNYLDQDKDTETRAELVVTKQNYNTVAKYFVDFCEKNNIPSIIDYDGNVKWEPEERIYKGSVNVTRSMQSRSIETRDFTCSGSKHQIIIMPNGELYSNSCDSKKYLGLIYTHKTFPKEEVICKTSTCSCCGTIVVKDKEGNIKYNGLKKLN